MSWLCCKHPNTPQTNNNETYPEPMKLRALKFLNIYKKILNFIVLPHKKQPYVFSRQNLAYLKYEKCHVPIIFFEGTKPILLVYSHGSGSTINNVYNLGASICKIYGISVMLYDYTGDGQSKGEFQNYETDLKIVLAWALHKGYNLQKIILCGFSIGSYSSLLLSGPMPCILISPICGIVSFVEGTTKQYEGQQFDNIKNAKKIKARILIAHGSNQMIPYSHAQTLIDCLRIRNNPQNLQLYRVQGYNHLNMPNFMLQPNAKPIIQNFIKKVSDDSDIPEFLKQTQNFKFELKQLAKKIILEFQFANK